MDAKWCSLFIPKYDYMVICVIERLGTSGQCKDGICHSVCPVWCVVRADTCRLFDVSIRDGRPAGVGKTASVGDQSSPGKIAGQYGCNSVDSGKMLWLRRKYCRCSVAGICSNVPVGFFSRFFAIFSRPSQNMTTSSYSDPANSQHEENEASASLCHRKSLWTVAFQSSDSSFVPRV